MCVSNALTTCVSSGEVGLPGVGGGSSFEEDPSGSGGDVGHQGESGAAQGRELL